MSRFIFTLYFTPLFLHYILHPIITFLHPTTRPKHRRGTSDRIDAPRRRGRIWKFPQFSVILSTSAHSRVTTVWVISTSFSLGEEVGFGIAGLGEVPSPVLFPATGPDVASSGDPLGLTPADPTASQLAGPEGLGDVCVDAEADDITITKRTRGPTRAHTPRALLLPYMPGLHYRYRATYATDRLKPGPPPRPQGRHV